LIERIEEVFPPELIDMVCKHLVHDREFADWALIGDFVYDNRQNAHPDVFSYVLDPAYVGKRFAASMTRAAYQATIPGDLYDPDGTALLEFATFDPFHLGVTPAPYLKNIMLAWLDLDFGDPRIGIEPGIKVLRLLRPSKDLRVRIDILSISSDAIFQPNEDNSHVSKFLSLFKPVHNHLVRGMCKSDFMRLRGATTFDYMVGCDLDGYADGLPYYLGGPWGREFNDYFWAESDEEEQASRQDLMRKLREAK
jgi:hypothetical protein